MSKAVQRGRFTADTDDAVVVFIIGMRINKLWKVHKWFPPFRAMPRMLRELERHPDKGLLGARFAVAGRTITSVQYWRSVEQLEAFARNRDDLHLPAWRAFNASVGGNGDVGVYHETFCVAPGAHESIYVNMPVFGLAAATAHVPVGSGTDSARDRVDKVGARRPG
jgi:hypothetical protein